MAKSFTSAVSSLDWGMEMEKVKGWISAPPNPWLSRMLISRLISWSETSPPGHHQRTMGRNFLGGSRNSFLTALPVCAFAEGYNPGAVTQKKTAMHMLAFIKKFRSCNIFPPYFRQTDSNRNFRLAFRLWINVSALVAARSCFSSAGLCEAYRGGTVKQTQGF
ncbi:MAG: hypothetical protein ABR928_16170 [Terracidiphilus sp.]